MKKNIIYKMLISAVILLYAVILYFLPFSCIFYDLTGIECLGCGMTRALISAVKLNFREAFSYHKMFWSVPILYICFLKDGKLFNGKIYNILFYIIMFIGYILNWIL